MSNFEFVRQALPHLHADCARAESYLTSDPRTACFYSRRVAEQLVAHLYEILALPEPYRDDLAARTHAAGFQRVVGARITSKLDLIRKNANAAVHATRPVRAEVALAVLREVFHLMVWATFHHSPRPDLAPSGAQLDPALAAQAAPLTPDELVRLAAKFEEQDRAHAEELAERDDLLAAHQAEIQALREQVATVQAAQAAAGISDTHDYREQETRDQFIDLLLREAGWLLDGPEDLEYQVAGMPNAQGTGYIDYVLWGDDGRPLAIVEAKRTRVSPGVGQQQALLYADALERSHGRRPVIYLTNGYEHLLWDEAGGYPPRRVQGFATRDELELMVQRRTTRLPLAGQPVDTDIAGRSYQQRAIQAVGASFDEKRRAALLVMATGTGKTRTAVAIVDQLMRAGWVKRALFLADRTALVNQAVNAFKAHLPSATAVNVLDAAPADLAGARIHVATYPTMLGRIQATDGDGRRLLGPGHYDLVIIDEAHRSVYARYGTIFEYFDALLLGLTATPKDEVDHNTYRLFDLEDGVPTDAYPLDEAVADGYLVPPRAVSVGTKFLRHGITYAELTEDERAEWDALDWGGEDIPDQVDAEAINRFLFNADTVDKVLATLIRDGHKVAGGERIAKTIIFAKTQHHAEFIAQRFDTAWPEHAGRLARVITSGVPYAQSLIDDFSRPEKSPHIAISVDMLDTGIDVPEVANLVFFKTVHSRTKFWQMIGRGTRLRPDLYGPGQHKTDFYVFDFCGNLEFFNQDLPGTEGSTTASLTQRIVETRVDLLHALGAGRPLPDADDRLRASLADALHEFVTGMTLDNVLVRPHRRAVELLGDRSRWDEFTSDEVELARDIAGLPSAASAVTAAGEVEARRFDLLILRRQLAQLEGDVATAEHVRRAVQAIAGNLLTKTAIPSVAERAELLEALDSDDWWAGVTLPLLEDARRQVRALVHLIDTAGRNPVYTDFVDAVSEGVEVQVGRTAPGMDPERFRARTLDFLRQHEDEIAIQKLRRNKQLTPADLESLERTLAAAGNEDLLAAAAAQSGGLGLFVRSLVGLDRAAAAEAFTRFLRDGDYTVDQIRFIDLLVEELTVTGVVEPRRLFESPFTDRAPTGPDHVFTDAEVTVIVDTLNDIRDRAIA